MRNHSATTVRSVTMEPFPVCITLLSNNYTVSLFALMSVVASSKTIVSLVAMNILVAMYYVARLLVVADPLCACSCAVSLRIFLPR